MKLQRIMQRIWLKLKCGLIDAWRWLTTGSDGSMFQSLLRRMIQGLAVWLIRKLIERIINSLNGCSDK